MPKFKGKVILLQDVVYVRGAVQKLAVDAAERFIITLDSGIPTWVSERDVVLHQPALPQIGDTVICDARPGRVGKLIAIKRNKCAVVFWADETVDDTISLKSLARAPNVDFKAPIQAFYMTRELDII